jgi:CheY-like chemotaxis protein
MRGPRAAKDRTAELLKRVNELEHETAKLLMDISALLQLTQRIGHDFNNVLQAIIGDTEQVAENQFDRVQEFAEAVLVSASRGVDLARELLSMGHEGEGAKLSAAKTAAPSRGRGAPGSPAVAVSTRILVVDDLQPIREFTRAVLAKAGYEVAVAANGAEALAAVRDADFALVLMDIHMPVMNGLTATRRIRELKGPRSNVAIVAISGNVPLHHVSSLMAAGMDDHICKPFKQAALLKKVEFWLNRPANLPISPPPEKPGETIVDEACELMGRPWVMRGLTKLREQIDEAFGTEPEVARQGPQLADQAHALVSLAALLGFSSLSQLCSTLEEACRSGHEVQPAFEQARSAASLARKAATDLIAT